MNNEFMELKKYKLEECCLHITDGEHGSVNDDLQGDYYLLSNKNIINGNIVISKDDRKINKATFDKINKRILLEEKDVIISTVGTLGKTAIIEGNINYTFQRSVGIIKPNPQIIDSYYLKYLLDTDYYQQLLIGLSVGAVQKCIFIGTLKSLPISIPSLPTQKKIANILQALDQKIALNRAINDNLEAMAKQLYDYWFVQYDFPNDEGKPYKSSGGKMVWNENLKREIPEGWDCMCIGDYAKCKGGYAFKSKDFTSKGTPVIKIGNIQEDYTLNMVDSQCINDFDNSLFIARKYDLVIAMTGATIGKFAISPKEYLVNQRVGRFDLGKSPLGRLGYLFNSLKQEYFREQVFQIASGCAQPNISSEQIDSIVVLKPKMSVLKNFNQLCEPILEQQVENILQIELLTKQRDELLPLLMNDQVSPLNSD